MNKNKKMLILLLAVAMSATTLVAQDASEAAPKTLKNSGIPGLDQTFNFSATESMDVVEVIYTLAHLGKIKNLVIGNGVAGQNTKLAFDGVTIGEALELVLSVNHLAYEINNDIITIMTDEEYSKLYGGSFYDYKKVKIVELKYADPSSVAKMLEKVKSTIGSVIYDQTTGTLVLIDTPAKIKEMETVISTADISTVSRVLPTETKTFRLQYANVEDMLAQLGELVTKDIGSIRADARTKTVIVTDLPHNMQKVEHMIVAFDRRSREVFIEAKIVQVTLSDDYRMGVDWNHIFQGISPRFSLQSTISPGIQTALGASTAVGTGIGSLTYKTIVAGGNLNVIVDALQTVGDAKVLSNPHVAVMEGEEAEIATVRDQPYAEAQFESGSTNVIGETLRFIPVGVTLTVTPKINDDGFITMAIKPEISSIDGFYKAFYTIPIVKKAYATTSVMIKDGETILIAGMIEEEDREVTRRVPFFGKIPLLGWLFKTHSVEKQMRETVIFLTPRTMSGDEQIQRLRDMKKEPKPLRSIGDRRKIIKEVR